MAQREGVVKFRQIFRKGNPLEWKILEELDSWRDVLHKIGLIGQDPLRYGGAGYGNVSQRLGPSRAPENKRRFVITGTQTGGLPRLGKQHYAVVLEYHPEQNLVIAEGPIKPSSESMTHGTLYDLDKSIKSVFHAHSPQIWKHSKRLKIPATGKSVEYGTPQMAEEVRRLYRGTNARNLRIFSMGGHKDGVITFGKSPEEAGLTMIKYLAKAMQLSG